MDNKKDFLKVVNDANSAFFKHIKTDSVYALFPDSVWDDFENQEESFKFTINLLKTIWVYSWLEKKETVVVERSEGKGVKVHPEDPQANIGFENFIRTFSKNSDSMLKKMDSFEPTNPSYYDIQADSFWQFWLKAWNTKP